MKRHYRTPRYVRAHPYSDLGNPNVAHKFGYTLVCMTPDGLFVYRLRWWGRVLDRLGWFAYPASW